MQSPVATNARACVIADARIDNRDELWRSLGPREGERSGDVELILACWMRWGEAMVDHLVGDFALALFDRHQRRLLVARDAAGQRPLFVRQHGASRWFASRPLALVAGAVEWNIGLIADGLADAAHHDERTCFAGISKVAAGEMRWWSDRDDGRRRWFNPSFEPLKLSDDAFVDAYRHHLEQAVAVRLAGVDGPLAAHLSSGYDSAAVAATAARLRPDRPIVALTVAPPLGFTPALVDGRSSDESSLAGLAARQHGMHHIVLRSSPPLTLELLRAQARYYQDPFRNVLNSTWFDATLREARDAGSSILLGGASGNLTLNAAPYPALGEWARQGQWLVWAREAHRLARSGTVRWRRIVAASVGPLLPDAAERLATRMVHGRTAISPFAGPALRGHRISVIAREPRGDGASRAQALVRFEKGLLVKGAAMELGVEELDPLADRRLIEFSLRLPPEQLLRAGVTRPLARRALADRLPPALIDSRHRGVQLINWRDAIHPQAVRDIVEEIGGRPSVAAMLDMPAIERAVVEWPTNSGFCRADYVRLAVQLPQALALGVMIDQVERDRQGIE